MAYAPASIQDPKKKQDPSGTTLPGGMGTLATAVVRPTPDQLASVGAPAAGPITANGLTAPAPVAQPAASPSPAVGTQLGTTIRAVTPVALNAAEQDANNQASKGAGLVNALSYPTRAFSGFVGDVTRGALGMPARADAGQPISGITAAQIQTNGQNASGGAGAASAGAQTPSNDPNYNPAADNISASNLAAANGLVRPNFSNVTGSANTTATALAPLNLPDSGVTIDGRKLAIGAMVNGVPTFSDGSAGVQRTMSDAAIKDLAQERSISRADKGALGHALASDALGYTPTQDQQVDALVRGAQGPLFARPTAQQQADSDRNAVALRDPRSALGTAAHNLAVDAQYGTGTTKRNSAIGLDALTKGVDAAGLSAQQSQQAAALTDQQGQDELANTALQGRNALATTGLELQRQQAAREGHPVTLDDGTLAIQDPVSGLVRPSLLADGTPAKTVVAKTDADTKRSNEIVDNIGKTAAELAKTTLPPPGAAADWKPNPSDLREQAARMQGLRIGTNKAGQRVAQVGDQVVVL